MFTYRQLCCEKQYTDTTTISEIQNMSQDCVSQSSIHTNQSSNIAGTKQNIKHIDVKMRQKSTTLLATMTYFDDL